MWDLRTRRLSEIPELIRFCVCKMGGCLDEIISGLSSSSEVTSGLELLGALVLLKVGEGCVAGQIRGLPSCRTSKIDLFMEEPFNLRLFLL